MLKRILSQMLLVATVVVLISLFQPLRFFETFAQPAGNCQTFKETNKTVCGKFLTYWQQHGGVAQQGFPISGEFTEVSDLNGKTYTVQYFERAVFELHPENKPPYDVLLSLLGSAFYSQKYPGGAPNQQANTSAGSILFPETGKRLGGRFLDYWRTHGGLMQQGYPISNEFMEKSDLNGQTYRVQYFERAVFELHLENPAPYDVLLSQLGRLQFNRKYPNGEPSGALSPTELKYKLFETFGKDLRYCDPDHWPLVRDENQGAKTWFDSVDKASEEYQAILKHNNISPTDKLTNEQVLLIYREHKKLNAVTLEKSGEIYKFIITVGDANNPNESGSGIKIEGTIDSKGSTTVTSRTTVRINCPICLAGDTLIDTPNGPVKVQDMKKGMAVWTTDKAGARVAGVVLTTAKSPAPETHMVVHLVLSDGRELYLSPGHPLASGRPVGTLSAGETVDGSTVKSAEWLPYKQAYTYDILPSGDTGAYWANDILLSSTLEQYDYPHQRDAKCNP